ncbi:MAG: RHS repeat-associated core domain-containing protein, partial [Gammaproteobacteria bacterium]
MNNMTNRIKQAAIALIGTGLLIATLTVQANTTITRYVMTDPLGNPVAKTDSTGAVIWRQSYTPYGQQYQQADSDGPGFTGHRNDAATGLVYMQARYYDPVIGRFLSVDPVGFSPDSPGHFNLYWYANGNPYRYTDPDGKDPPDTLTLSAPLISGACLVSGACEAIAGGATIAGGVLLVSYLGTDPTEAGQNLAIYGTEYEATGHIYLNESTKDTSSNSNDSKSKEPAEHTKGKRPSTK